MKPLRSIAAFAMAGMVAAFMMAGLTGTLDVAAVAAVPAAATAPIHASAGSMVRPSHANGPAVDINCPHGRSKFTIYHDYPGSCNWEIYSCDVGKKYSISPPDYAWNDCKSDVIMYSNSDESGSLLCIGPATGGDLQGTFRSFQVIASDSCTLFNPV